MYEGRRRGPLRWFLHRRAVRANPLLAGAFLLPFWARHPVLWFFGFLMVKLPARGAKWVGVLGWRWKRALAPLYVAFGMWVTAALSAFNSAGWRTVGMLGLLGAAVVWQRMGYRCLPRFTRAHRPERRHWIMAAYATGAGLTVSASYWHGLLTIPGLFVVWAGVAGWRTGWWIRPALERAPVVDHRIQKWDEEVREGRLALPGAQLTDVEDIAGIANAWSATIDLSGTRLKTPNAISAAGDIAARFGLPQTSVIVERHSSDRHDLARVQVFERNPLTGLQMFRGLTFDPATGFVTVGRHTDGSPARWQFFVPGWGACHGLIFGTTGSGKGGLLNLLLTEARHSGLICTFFGDPDAGESAPEWQESVTCFAGSIPRIREMLQAVERMMDDRKTRRRGRWQDEQGRWRRGSGKFTPTAADPLVLVFLDEFPDIAKDPECLRIVELILRKGRKYGFGLVLIAQVPSLDQLESQVVRSMASGMNIAAFRTSDSMSGAMGLPMSLPVDPADLPSHWPDGSITAGLGYLARTQMAASPMRTWYQDDPLAWALSGQPAELSVPLIVAANGPLMNWGFHANWARLLDEEDDDVIGYGDDGTPGGVPIRGGDGASVTDPNPAPAAAPVNAGKAWDRIEAYMEQHPNGVTTRMIKAELGIEQNAAGNALARAKERGKAHERNRVWRLGPADENADELIGVGS